MENQNKCEGCFYYKPQEEVAIYNLKDLSVKMKISVRTLRGYAKNGKLKAKKIGKAYYVTEPNLMAFLDPDT